MAAPLFGGDFGEGWSFTQCGCDARVLLIDQIRINSGANYML